MKYNGHYKPVRIVDGTKEVFCIEETKDFFIHKATTDDEWSNRKDGYAITHNRTGLAALKGFYDPNVASEAMHSLQNCGLNWDWDSIPEGEAATYLSKVTPWKERLYDGEPEWRNEAFDSLDSELYAFVVGLDEYNRICTVETKDNKVSGFRFYYYTSPDQCIDSADGMLIEADWYREVTIDDCHFYAGMPVGEAPNEIEPDPINLSIEEAERFSKACIAQAVMCDNCELYFDENYNFGGYVESWSQLFCNNCYAHLVETEEICEPCNLPSDECNCLREEEELPDTEDNFPPTQGELIVSMDKPIAEFKRDLENAIMEQLSWNERKAILDARIEGTLKEMRND